MASPPITFSGLASGLDTSALVEALIEIERAPIQRLEIERGERQQEDTLFQDLNTRISALRDAAATLDNRNSTLSGASLNEEFFRFSATTADGTVIEPAVTGTPSPGSFEIEVVSLATAARVVSNTRTDPDELFGDSGDSVTIDFGGATSIVVDVPAGGISYNGLRDAINTHADNDGVVQASVFDDGTGAFRLVIAGAATGAANDLSVTESFAGGTDLVDESVGQAAADAALRVFGVDVVRADNSVGDLLDGVTLDLKAPGLTTVTIDRDLEAMGEALQTFVDAYNSFRDFVTAQSAFNDVTEAAGPLSGDSTLRGIDVGIRGALGAQYAGGPFEYLSDLGLRFDRDGRLEFDSALFSERLESDAGAVRQLFSAAAAALGNNLAPVLQSGDGVIATRRDGIEAQIDRIDDQIARLEILVASREETLRRQFTQLESLVSTIQAQSGFLQGLGQNNNNGNNS